MTGIFVAWNDNAVNGTAGWMEDGTGCHIWLGSKNWDGYGQARTGGVSRRVHCVRYEREVGPIPAGMELDHLCRRRDCVNPRHLEPVSHRENVLRGDSPSAKAASQTHCKRGHSLTGNNLIISDLARGVRVCVVCGAARRARANAARRIRRRLGGGRPGGMRT